MNKNEVIAELRKQMADLDVYVNEHLCKKIATCESDDPTIRMHAATRAQNMAGYLKNTTDEIADILIALIQRPDDIRIFDAMIIDDESGEILTCAGDFIDIKSDQYTKMRERVSHLGLDIDNYLTPLEGDEHEDQA